MGYEAARLDKLAEILPAPGYTDEHIHIFLATGLKPVQQKLEEDQVGGAPASGGLEVRKIAHF